MNSAAVRPASSFAMGPALLCAILIFALTLGTRQSLALFIEPINSTYAFGLGAISFAFALAQLVWGFAQPIAGAMADRYGTARTIALGGALIVAGTALTPWASSRASLALTVGVLAAAGSGFAGPSVLLAAVNRLVPPQKRGFAMGLVNAGGSLGQFLIAPLSGILLVALGWRQAMWILAILTCAVIPLSVPLMGKSSPGMRASSDASLGASINTALKDSSFMLLSFGFFVCGFHVAFIATHLPGVIALCGLPPRLGAWSLSIIGLFNIAGSLLTGWAMTRWRMKYLLAFTYSCRALAVLAFMLAPKTQTTVIMFAAVLGFTYLSTVPPTAGLVSRWYGPRYMATLFGMVMLAHQIGGFLGAYMGGRVFESTHSFDAMWYADIALAVLAALAHLPLREPRIAALQTA